MPASVVVPGRLLQGPWTNTVTKYEHARLLGVRAAELAANAPPLVRVSSPDTRTIAEIAEAEFAAGLLPHLLTRRLPCGTTEVVPCANLRLAGSACASMPGAAAAPVVADAPTGVAVGAGLGSDPVASPAAKRAPAKARAAKRRKLER